MDVSFLLISFNYKVQKLGSILFVEIMYFHALYFRLLQRVYQTNVCYWSLPEDFLYSSGSAVLGMRITVRQSIEEESFLHRYRLVRQGLDVLSHISLQFNHMEEEVVFNQVPLPPTSAYTFSRLYFNILIQITVSFMSGTNTLLFF